MKMADKLDDINKRLLVIEKRLDQYISDKKDKKDKKEEEVLLNE